MEVLLGGAAVLHARAGLRAAVDGHEDGPLTTTLHCLKYYSNLLYPRPCHPVLEGPHGTHLYGLRPHVAGTKDYNSKTVEVLVRDSVGRGTHHWLLLRL